MGNINLIVMKKSRKKPNVGDVFAVQPEEGLYYFGKVIKTDVESKDGFINGSNLIFVYNYASDTKIPPNNLDEFKLLFPPCFIGKYLWSDGIFETIANMGVTENDRSVDFGFKSYHGIIDENAHKIDRIPEYLDIYAYGTNAHIESSFNVILNKQKTEGKDYVVKDFRAFRDLSIEYYKTKEQSNIDEPKEDLKTTTPKSTLKGLKTKKKFLKEWKKALKEEGDSLGYTIEDVNKCASILDAYIDKLQSYNGKATNEEILECVKEVVLSLNELNKNTDESLIETMEREELCKFIRQAAQLAGLETDETDITEEWREW
jgi:hypothetical protein